MVAFRPIVVHGRRLELLLRAVVVVMVIVIQVVAILTDRSSRDEVELTVAVVGVVLEAAAVKCPFTVGLNS